MVVVVAGGGGGYLALSLCLRCMAVSVSLPPRVLSVSVVMVSDTYVEIREPGANYEISSKMCFFVSNLLRCQ